MSRLFWVVACIVLNGAGLTAETPKAHSRYQPKLGEFPPNNSALIVDGELVAADFIHRTGQFRLRESGALVDFAMQPFGSIVYLNAEADLRDVPLGTYFQFHLHDDANGRPRLATMKDQFTLDARNAFTYHLDELKLADGKLRTTKHNLVKKLDELELLVTDQTKVWKDDKQIKLTDLAVHDELRVNLTGKIGVHPGRCTDIWVGHATHTQASERQAKKFAAFVKFRGLPAWIDRTTGNKLIITLFSGDQPAFQKNWMNDFVVGKEISVVVANEELRTWNPPTDRERAQLLEIQKAPTDCYGSSGVRLVVSVPNMLEGYRKGRIVRLFGTGWTLKDPFYGEGLMNYGYGRLQTPEIMELTAKEYPSQFPFRTEYGNDQLPWYTLKPGVAPPPFSEHVVLGELVKVDADGRAGQFRPAAVPFFVTETTRLLLNLDQDGKLVVSENHKKEMTRVLLLNVDQDGKLVVSDDDKKDSENQIQRFLIDKFEFIKRDRGDQVAREYAVVVRADSRANFEDVYRVMRAAKGAGFSNVQLRAKRSSGLVDFTLIPQGSAKFLNADAHLSDLPLGSRCRFHLYQDAKGAFTQASLISDEFSYLAQNAVVYRIDALKLDEGKLHVARQIPQVKNYNGDMEQPPDIGRTELRVDADTRVWRGDKQLKPADLAVGDLLLVNISGESIGKPVRCTDIWVGVDTHKQVSEQQRKTFATRKRSPK